MKTEITKYNWITNNALRLDASCYLSDGRQTKLLIEKSPLGTSPLSSLTTDIFMGPRFKRYYVNSEETGVPFMGGADMQKSDLTNLKLLSKKMTKNIDQLYLKKNWILVTRSGTIGQIVFTTADFEQKTATEDVIRIIANVAIIKPGFLYAFLASQYGYNLLTQSTYGAVIQHIEPHHLKHIPIPRFSEKKQTEIHNLIDSSSKLRVQANNLLQEALEYFQNEYQSLLKSKLSFRKNINKVNFSWVVSNNDKGAEDTLDKIKSNKFLFIKDIKKDLFSPPMFKHIYLKKNNGYPFFKGGELRRAYRKEKLYLSTRGVKDINDYIVKEGTILVYKSGPRNGMLGKVFMTDRTIDGCCLSDHVIRIVIEDVKLRYWVFAFLKSKVGLKLLQNLATGSAILFITSDRLEKLPIPIPEDERLNKNYNLIKDYLEKFSIAHEKEYKAIQIVENEIASWQKSNTQQEA